ncbi:IclR family transcriptional regulator [Rhizobium sp. CFBP 8752]|uniref:IclR family transcriptional regulator n=1 Tax=Rhizobium sp. CFBP 8752 TaxID=2775301 RepID=UPI001783A82A|nr:IclR family transcriptional regulator [Rhizobium sp. CFBP 8752]MBD8664218.1 IclR family transcriptional regulator [Rhizobium sp. CFBP 8752]
MTEKTNTTQNVRAVTRALAILNSFAGKGLQSLAEVTQGTGLDKGTTRRLLLTLMESGFIAQDPTTQHYRLGRAVRDLAANVADDLDLRGIALPVMAELAADLHITAFISVYNEGDVVCVERIHDMKGIEVHWWAVGGTLPYNCGGAPKLLLAYQPAQEINRVLKRVPVAMTPKSVTDVEELRDQLEKIRRRGWECAVDDVSLGLTALAVPVRDRNGEIVCCISMAGLTPQMISRGRPVHLARLQSAAEQIERRLKR